MTSHVYDLLLVCEQTPGEMGREPAVALALCGCSAAARECRTWTVREPSSWGNVLDDVAASLHESDQVTVMLTAPSTQVAYETYIRPHAAKYLGPQQPTVSSISEESRAKFSATMSPACILDTSVGYASSPDAEVDLEQTLNEFIAALRIVRWTPCVQPPPKRRISRGHAERPSPAAIDLVPVH